MFNFFKEGGNFVHYFVGLSDGGRAADIWDSKKMWVFVVDVRFLSLGMLKKQFVFRKYIPYSFKGSLRTVDVYEGGYAAPNLLAFFSLGRNESLETDHLLFQ